VPYNEVSELCNTGGRRWSLTPGLVSVVVAARAIALAGHDLPITWWSPIAFLWHDAAVVLLFAAMEKATAAIAEHAAQGNSATSARSAVALRDVLYAALVCYVALNVPVTRVLSTPLTWTMWRAARGPLWDSIFLYATWDNLLLMMIVVAVAIVVPTTGGLETTALRATRFRAKSVIERVAVLVLLVLAILGPIAASHVDTRGLERNAWTALAITAMPSARASTVDDAWTTSGFEETADAELDRFRGAAAGRNVVMVSLESTAAKYLGVYGAAADPMPNLTSLANHGIVFDQAYAVYPESIKGLFSILCSSYPALDRPAEAYVDVPCTSIADVLGRRGYRAALFHSGRFGYLGMEAVVRGRGYGVLEDAGDIGGRHESSFGVDEPSTVARILRWVDTQSPDDRFFVTYLPIAGHHPYDTPQPGPFPEHTDVDRYRNALHYGDAAIGALIRGLRARGLQNRTLWVIYGDHGEAFGEHDGNYGHTFQIFDENVRVPLMVAAPGLIAAPRRSAHVVSLIDTAPTILDAIGERVPDAWQGRSVLDGRPRMALFFTDYSLELLGLRDGRFKMIDELGSGRARLFDVERDPREIADVSDQHAARTAWYARNLRRWSAAQQRRLSAANSSPR
jgi:arylsulfatase A-like enzyme